MRHGRPDYDQRIQDTAGIIPADEPVFLIRGQDKIAHLAVEAYAVLAEAAGHHEAAVSARSHAAWIKNWPTKKVPTPNASKVEG